MSDNLKYDTIRKCTSELKNAVEHDLCALSGELLAADLITEANYSALNNKHESEPDRAAKLVEFIRKRVGAKSGHYDKFIEVLKEREFEHENILKVLDRKYKELISSSFGANLPILEMPQDSSDNAQPDKTTSEGRTATDSGETVTDAGGAEQPPPVEKGAEQKPLGAKEAEQKPPGEKEAEQKPPGVTGAGQPPPPGEKEAEQKQPGEKDTSQNTPQWIRFQIGLRNICHKARYQLLFGVFVLLLSILFGYLFKHFDVL